MMLSAMVMESVRVLLLLCATSCAALMLRRSSSARRHFVWSIGVMAVLVLPVLSLGLPVWRVTVPAVQLRSAAGPSNAGSDGARESTGAPTTTVSAHMSAMETAGDASGNFAAANSREQLQASSTPALSRTVVFLLTYLAGVLGVLLYIAAGMMGARRLIRNAHDSDNARILDAVGRIREDLGIRREVRVKLATGAMPVTWGFTNPVVVLPTAATSWMAARLDAVLRHELAHIRRGDAATQLLAQLACAMHWYNPLTWVAAARMRVEREHACDDILLRAGVRASEYGAELVDLARAFGKTRTAIAALAMARPTSLRARLNALLDERRLRAHVSTRFAVPSVIGMTAILIPLASVLPIASPTARGAPPTVGGASPTARAVSPVASVSPVFAAMADTQGPTESCLTRDSKKHSTSINADDDGHYTMKYSGDDCSGNVRVEGKLHYSGDFMHITGLGDGGSLMIDETDHGTRRRLQATPSGNGLAYKWSVDGHDHPFDAEARAWFDNWTLVLFREFGFAAEDRATAMLSGGGVDAILREVSLMQSDYVQATYIGVAMEHGHLNAADMDRVLNVVGTSIDSDYYAATILERAAKGVVFNAKTQALYLHAAARIESDYYRENVLAELLQNGRLDRDEIAEVLRQGKIIGSDYYRATLLSTVAQKYALDASLRSTYLAAVSDIESDYYKSDVLQKLAAQRDLSDAEIASIIAAGRTITSDYYQSSFLVELASQHAIRGAARDAFTAAMNRIDSKMYRSSVADALRGSSR